MPLLILSDQIVLHINFYIVFYFMIKKKMNDYCWELRQLNVLYAKLKLSSSIVFVIDMKKSLMIAIREIFSTFNHVLCSWYINNNVLINCKKSFSTKEVWEKKFTEWKSVMYFSSNREYRTAWAKFSEFYNLTHEDCVKYLHLIYLRNYRRRFVKCYTDEMLHFEITMTSRSESEHAVLKRQLITSIEDLKTVVNEINLLLINEMHNHLIAFDEVKTRLSNDFRKLIF
jgi:hypothetical protein